MCGMCPDVYGGCGEIECGALPRVDLATGKRRSRYMRWFTFGEVACRHVRAEHQSECPVPVGGYRCTDVCERYRYGD